jgi:hypothetical protein
MVAGGSLYSWSRIEFLQDRTVSGRLVFNEIVERVIKLDVRKRRAIEADVVIMLSVGHDGDDRAWED